MVIGHSCELSSDVIGCQTSIGEKAVIAENVFISDACWIGRGARLSANIKLWPEKVVEEGAILTRSLVWEDKWLRELFTDSRVTGLSNIEMNPEFGAKLGAAYGAFIGAGKTVVTCRDSDNVSRMMNRALICGLISAGVNTFDLRATSIPLLRHELSSGKEAGGIHVRRSPFDKNLTDIIFFDANGKDLPGNRTKSVERLFFGEDFARAPREKVGEIFFPERTTEVYKEKFLSSLDIEAISKKKFRIVIDYSNGIASTIFPIILGSFDCQVVALNAHLDPRKLTRDRNEFEYSLKQLCHIVTSLKYDIGCLIDAGGEKLLRGERTGTRRGQRPAARDRRRHVPGDASRRKGHRRPHHLLRRNRPDRRTRTWRCSRPQQPPCHDGGGIGQEGSVRRRDQGRVHLHRLLLRHRRDVLRGQDPRDDGDHRQAPGKRGQRHPTAVPPPGATSTARGNTRGRSCATS